jgi:hypothetical protein
MIKKKKFLRRGEGGFKNFQTEPKRNKVREWLESGRDEVAMRVKSEEVR